MAETSETQYLVTVVNKGEERALARNEIENLLRDHVTKHPHFEEYEPIVINVSEA